MGLCVDEPRERAIENEEFLAGVNMPKINTKKRRQRKSKQTDTACISSSDVLLDVSSYPSNAMSMQTRDSPCGETDRVEFLRLTPDPDPSEDRAGPRIAAQQPNFHDPRMLFPGHWSQDDISNGIKKGEVFKALFCVNAYNNIEAYGRINGLPTDILISGLVAQNRAVEGDIVAVLIDKPSLWPRMKGSNGPSSSCASNNISHKDSIRFGDCYFDKSKHSKGFQHPFSSEDDPYAANSTAHGTHEEDDISVERLSQNDHVNGDANDLATLLQKLSSKRPTGRVVAVIEKSRRRESIVGYISTQQRKKNSQKKNKPRVDKNRGHVLLIPTDSKFTKMMIPLTSLPEDLMKRMEDNDLTTLSDLVAAKIVNWSEESNIPEAHLIKIFGKGSDIEAQLAAILFENGINTSDFSPEVLSNLPSIPWEVPQAVSSTRLDFRKVCTFTIDPATATDLDDALSVEELLDGNFRVAVHIADVSYFVTPLDTDLDNDARNRATSVYLPQRKLPMLPRVLSDNLASLHPGQDRLTFSILWKLSPEGEILDQRVGLTIISSCCKLSYEQTQDIIDGIVTLDWPTLYGNFEWSDVIRSVKILHEISKILRNNRFRNGAVSIENTKPVILFDDQGIPYDLVFPRQMDSHFLVEEFMLLANKSAAELIYRAYPSYSLLRRHPDPNPRKLQEFESLCNKHGLKLDFSSSSQFHHSLELIKKELKDDNALLTILMSFSSRSMRLAEYICSGDYKDSSDFRHYALALPLYTHFTSPLRRYPDIIVHRTLKAILEAQHLLSSDELQSVEAQEILFDAAKLFRVSDSKYIANIASHCNDMKLATRHVKDSTDKLSMWALIRRNGVLYSEAKVIGLGPRFMSIYITKLAIEKRINYDEVKGVTVSWLESTSTLILSKSLQSKTHGRKLKPFDDAIMLFSSGDVEREMTRTIEPVYFPVTVSCLSVLPVCLNAVGGDDGPIDIVARLYCCSYMI